MAGSGVTRQPRVAVVGAGLAGLTAGLALAKRGWRVDLYERSRLLGGKATSFEVDGHEVDCGQHVVLACCTATLELIDELGLSDSLYIQPRFEVTVLSRNRPPAHLRASDLPAPLHLMAGFARYPHLTTLDRIQVGRALIAARGDRNPGGDMLAWLRRHHQSARALRAFWEPFLVPALNAPLERVSAEMGLFTIRTAFLGDRDAARIAYLKVPLARLAEAAAARLDGVHMRQAVVGVHREGNRVTGVKLSGGAGAACDACVVAVPPSRLRPMLEDDPALGITGLDSFEPMPIVDVHLWYDRPVLGCDFAALLGSPVQWVFEKSPGYVCCSMSAADKYVQRPEQELVELCRAALASVLPQAGRARLLRGAATRDPDATFIPAPGVRRPGPATAFSNLVIAGAWTDTGWPATIESAVRSGRTAALMLYSNTAGWTSAPNSPAADPTPEVARAV
jgi:squalene-associated FAD-dependent desaturase